MTRARAEQSALHGCLGFSGDRDNHRVGVVHGELQQGKSSPREELLVFPANGV